MQYIRNVQALTNHCFYFVLTLCCICGVWNFDILILPNIAITQEDEDEYEDDPDAYIKNDLEESDVETRRRYCMKFV